MSDIAERYRGLAEKMNAVVHAVPASAWDNQSPCPDWTARSVVQHIADTSEQFLGFIGVHMANGPAATDDPVSAWANARAAIQNALDDETTAKKTYQGMMGEAVFEETVGLFGCIDMIVHRWDLAQAAGLDATLTPDEMDFVRTGLAPLGNTIRGEGAFGPTIDVADTASEQERFVAWLGRRPIAKG